MLNLCYVPRKGFSPSLSWAGPFLHRRPSSRHGSALTSAGLFVYELLYGSQGCECLADTRVEPRYTLVRSGCVCHPSFTGQELRTRCFDLGEPIDNGRSARSSPKGPRCPWRGGQRATWAHQLWQPRSHGNCPSALKHVPKGAWWIPGWSLHSSESWGHGCKVQHASPGMAVPRGTPHRVLPLQMQQHQFKKGKDRVTVAGSFLLEKKDFG